jgi:hypothetical protein
MRNRLWFACLATVLALGAPAQAQIPTGIISGVVSSDEGPLPGVTVTANSPAMQGERMAITGEGGAYNMPSLPPGDYTLTFALEGFDAITSTVRVAAAQTAITNVTMGVAAMSEEIVVFGTRETISSLPQAATTYQKEMIETLPMERNIRETVQLNAGVSVSGPGTNARNGGISISGAQSSENLFLVNGVVINENLRGQPFDLFIEDAVQETTVTTSGVSAEYGRFAGGVVNVLTRSGSNELHGAFRTNFTNQDWESATDLTTSQSDEINERFEATLGGFLWKDRIWYFLAGRDFSTETTGNTSRTLVPFPVGRDQQRYEAKLTVALNPSHRVVGSYMEIEDLELGNFFGTILDTRSVNNRETPNELLAFNYSGLFGPNFVAEAQYSEREFTFIGSGSKFTDRINGTLLVDSVTGERWWSPTFCGVCRPEERDNENLLVKGSYFLTTENLGSHDIVAGYDTFTDIRAADNHQSGSDFRILISNTIVRGQDLFPQLISGANATRIQWNPILQSSLGTDFVTNSFFLNDRWRVNDQLTLNVGLRYDENDGEDASGQKVADDSRISPRLGASYDLRGDGDWIFHANYGEYVAAIASTQANGSAQGGNPAAYQWFYRGPSINADPTGSLLTADQALAAIFAWFDSQGGVNNTSNLAVVDIPGATTIIPESLDSQYTTEYSLGVSKQIGTRGMARFDYVHRDGNDFYVTRTDTSTGSTLTPSGQRANVNWIINDDSLLERTYDGLHTQGQYRWESFSLGATYTLSQSKGNVDGETAANGPVSSAVRQFPEYKDLSWNNPEGDLANDQRHRARIWGVWDAFRTEHHHLSLSFLQSFSSGTPYAAVGTVDTRFNATTNPGGVVNPGYAIPPASVAYYFTDRDEFHTDDITSTDLSANYSFLFSAIGQDFEIYFQPEVLNVFDEDGVGFVNTAVQTALTAGSGLQRFNAFTETPVEGVHWRKGSNFGKPTNELHYQQPRTFRFSVGFRF